MHNLRGFHAFFLIFCWPSKNPKMMQINNFLPTKNRPQHLGTKETVKSLCNIPNNPLIIFTHKS